MTKDDFLPFTQYLCILSDYYRCELTATTIKIYWQHLEKYKLSSIKEAGKNYIEDIEHGHFMPKVSGFLKYLSSSDLDNDKK